MEVLCDRYGRNLLIEFIFRIVFFTIFESPKYLVRKGWDEEEVKVVHEVAKRNGKTSSRISRFIPSQTYADLHQCPSKASEPASLLQVAGPNKRLPKPHLNESPLP